MSELRPSSDDSSASNAGFLEMQKRVKGTNINEQTLLATDYLNHFNEIIMLLGMLPDMPDCLEDAKEWSPKSYKDHFSGSSIANTELAVEAYDHAPTAYRQMFEENISRMDKLVASSIERIEAALNGGDAEALVAVTARAVRALQRLVDLASAIIHGDKPTLEQDEIDDLLAC